MVILIYGKDGYRARLRLNEIIADQAAQKVSVKTMEAAAIGFDELNIELRQRTIFTDKKLIVVKGLFLEKELKEKFLANIGEFLASANSFLLYEQGAILKTDSLLTALKKKGTVEEMVPLSGENLRKWVKKEAAAGGAKISEAAINRLSDYVGTDLWLMANETAKLANYKKGETIEAKDVELLVRPIVETKIFETIDALATKNAQQAFTLLHQHLESGESPFYVLTMVAFQFRNLLLIKDLLDKGTNFQDLARLTGLHPFVVKKSYSQASRFTLDELKRIYQKIFRVDGNIKKGRLAAGTALDILIAEICSSGPKRK